MTIYPVIQRIPDDQLPLDMSANSEPTPFSDVSQQGLADTSAPTDTVYKIEKVINHRTHKGRKQYFVKWEGYSAKHNSWVDEMDIIHTDANETEQHSVPETVKSKT